jgi:hypothetical protein
MVPLKTVTTHNKISIKTYMEQMLLLSLRLEIFQITQLKLQEISPNSQSPNLRGAQKTKKYLWNNRQYCPILQLKRF